MPRPFERGLRKNPIDYFEESPAEAGNGAVLVAGVVAGLGADAGALLIRSSFLLEPEPCLGMNAGEVMHNKPTIAAKTQVPFSSTSVVCLTPINWLPMLPSELFNPPPLGFCTRTMKPSTSDASMTMIPKTKSIKFI